MSQTSLRVGPATLELATVLRLTEALSARLVNVGHGRDEHSVRCADEFVRWWEAAGGEIGTVTSWPAQAASWQRPACRLAAGLPDAWVVADRPDGWAAFLPRLAATPGWRACRTVSFAHLVEPRPPRFPEPAAVEGLRGSRWDGSAWIVLGGELTTYLAS